MHAMQGSDRCVVPVKQPDNEGQPSAEAAEGRRQPKENDAQTNTPPTQRGARVSQGLSGVREQRGRGNKSSSLLCCIT